MPCKTFPVTVEGENPAIRLFGNRLFNDQSHTEFLIELLLVMACPKRVGEGGVSFNTPLPDRSVLGCWPPGQELQYAPKARLNLKLFAFMGASRLDSRHATHRAHYSELVEKLQASIRVTEPGTEGEVLRTLENLFLGFHGTGSGRTWCAQNFLPVCPSLVAAETIWGESVARREKPEVWQDLMQEVSSYFASNKRLFLARGGEVLYLQVCNALRQKTEVVREWVRQSGVEIEAAEQEPTHLHEKLQRALTGLLDQSPRALRDIAEFIDVGVESGTARATDMPHGSARYVAAGACAEESWQEGYLFAVDLLRLCSADLDIVERLQLLEAACAMQVLRTLAAQSARYSESERETTWPGYRLAVSAPEERRAAVKRISRHTAKLAERLVYHAIRAPGVPPPPPATREKRLKDADRRYGGKLFTGMAKRIGFLIPRRGAGARFTLNERLLRLLVVTTVPVGGRLTFDRFKALLEARHGLVFDADGLARANAWADGVPQVSLGDSIDAWLQEMLTAAGMLINLSDSCSLVENPAAKKRN